jgi:hypothetical protein
MPQAASFAEPQHPEIAAPISINSAEPATDNRERTTENFQLHINAIQTPAAVPLAPDTLKSTKFPGATVTFPEALHADPDATEEQASVVFAMLPGVPCRSVTVIVPD